MSSWLDVGIFEIIQSSAIFLICKYIYQSKDGIYSIIRKFLESGQVSKLILSISRASYGMYLFNLIPVFMYYYYLRPLHFTGTQVCIFIMMLSVSTFIISWMVVVILSKIPIIKNLSGFD